MSQRGMLPCFLGGRVSLLFSNICRALIIFLLVLEGYIDDVIEPSKTRRKIIRALQMLENKRETLPPKKHGSIPL
jgi:hypothetical protein